ncbi:MAG: methyltransferase domain-containing protein [Bacillota bacterium]
MMEQKVHAELWDLVEIPVPGDADFYTQYARLSGGPVLVLFCGTGRIVVPIARQGIPVMGMETDAAIVERAKRKAQEAGANKALFVRGDPTSFLSSSKHSLVMIPNGALSRLLTVEDQRACLIAARNGLALGGKLLLDLPILDRASFTEEEPPVVRQLPGSQARQAIIHRSRHFDPTRQIVEELVACEFVEEGEVVRKEYLSQARRFATPAEVMLLLEGCGFATVTYGDFDQHPFLPGAGRLVIEASRR